MKDLYLCPLCFIPLTGDNRQLKCIVKTKIALVLILSYFLTPGLNLDIRVPGYGG